MDRLVAITELWAKLMWGETLNEPQARMSMPRNFWPSKEG